MANDEFNFRSVFLTMLIIDEVLICHSVNVVPSIRKKSLFENMSCLHPPTSINKAPDDCNQVASLHQPNKLSTVLSSCNITNIFSYLVYVSYLWTYAKILNGPVISFTHIRALVCLIIHEGFVTIGNE